jgi:hypothetical protein
VSWDQVSTFNSPSCKVLQDTASFVLVLTENLLGSLAYAELYLTLAIVLQKFEMEIFETTLDDVTFERDYFVGQSRDLGSQGIRAIVTGRVA